MLLDHPRITERLFFPRKQPLAHPFRVPCPGAELACHHQVAGPPGGHSGKRRTFIHFHGNGEVVADYVPDHADAMVELGVDVFFAEYRGYGGSTGKPGLSSIPDDVDAIVAALGQPALQLIVYGRSLGSLYAVELAHRHPGVAGLIIESGIADVLERLLVRVRPDELGVTRDELAATVSKHFDQQRKIAGYGGRLLIMHAKDDEILDVSHARRNHAWSASPQKQLVLFERGGHNALLSTNWPQYLDTLRRFIAAIE